MGAVLAAVALAEDLEEAAAQAEASGAVDLEAEAAQEGALAVVAVPAVEV